jgi:hypothetical protein
MTFWQFMVLWRRVCVAKKEGVFVRVQEELFMTLLQGPGAGFRSRPALKHQD